MKNPRLMPALVLSCLAVFAGYAAAIPPEVSPTASEVNPIPLGAMTPEGFDDPDHAHYFRYQAFLLKSGLEGLDAAKWKALTPDARAARLRDGESFLKKRFESLLTTPRLDEAERALLRAVWGPQVQAAVGRLASARLLGDPAQVRLALDGARGALGGLTTGLTPDWNRLFDGGTRRADDAVPNADDYLRPRATPGSFTERLGTPEVQQVLATRQSFRGFLQQNDVPAAAVPGMMAAYDVLSKAEGPEKAELGHILPTMVTFLMDGKKIVLQDLPGALGFAVPGPYDRPERVGVTAALQKKDPVVAGKTLAHEFQHIYDMYVGRYYTLDSEMRGFKTAVLYFQVLGKAAPEKLDSLRRSDDDSTRAIMQD